MFEDVDNNQQSNQANGELNSNPASSDIQKRKQQTGKEQNSDQQSKAKSGSEKSDLSSKGEVLSGQAGEEQNSDQQSTAKPGSEKSDLSSKGEVASGQVEDIFAGVDQGAPQTWESREEQKENISQSPPSIFNKAFLIFAVIVVFLAIIILGASYGVSEWLTSSLGV